MLIGKLALESGFSRDTIRYYEKLGLILSDEFSRHQNNYKNYSPQILESLAQISQLKTLGFTLAEIADLLKSFERSSLPCTDLPTKLHDKIALFDKKIGLLEQYRHKLKLVEQACDGTCDERLGLPGCFSTVRN